MQGIKRGRPTSLAGGGDKNLAQLRKSVIWSSPTNPTAIRKGAALQERLEELLVLELHKDGGRSFLTFTVRGLYKHVLMAITNKISGKRERDEVHHLVKSKKGTARKGGGGGGSATTMSQAMDAPVVLGALASHKECEEDQAQDGEKEEPTSVSLEMEQADLSNIPEIPKRQRNVQPASSYTNRFLTAKAENATYRERLGGYLHPRDMRRLVTPFSASNEPGLIVRRHVMLLNFDPMRAVILRDRLLVIIPDGADSILVQLEKRVRGGITEMERSFLGGTSHGYGSEDDIGQSGHSSRGGGRKRRFNKHTSSSDAPSSSENGRSFASAVPNPQTHYSHKSSHDTDVTSSDGGMDTTRTMKAYMDAVDDDNEWNELQGTEWIDLPFELQCTDAVLHTVSAFLSEDTIELQQAAADYIHRILKDKTGSQDDPLTIIRAVKEAVREMSGRVKGFVQSMNRILDEDEDMALMNLTRLQTHPERFMYPVTAEVLEEESDEPELILESYLQEGLSLVNVLDSIQGQIDTAAELVDQRLDSVRNRILLANMVLTAISVAIGAASLVGSMFGMNVPVPYEEDDGAFRKIVFGTLAGALGICAFILLSLFRSGTMPQIGLGST